MKTLQYPLRVISTFLLSAVFAVGALLASLPAVAQESALSQHIVVSLKLSPARLFGNGRFLWIDENGFEAACVSVLMAFVARNTGAEVTYFPTLGGVWVLNGRFLNHTESPAGHHQCHLPPPMAEMFGGQDQVYLRDLLAAMQGAGIRILACPLCWTSRFGEPDLDQDVFPGGHSALPYGSVASSEEVASMIGAADKFIDF